MEKPIVLAMEELKQNIMKAVQDSQLPIYIVEPIVKEMYQQCNMANEEFKMKQIAEYNQELAKEQENKNEE